MGNRVKPSCNNQLPQAVKRRIAELVAHPGTDDHGRALLERLATYQIMKTDVWGKLPSEPSDLPERLIDWIAAGSEITPAPS